MTHPIIRVTRTGDHECPACGSTWSPDDGIPPCEPNRYPRSTKPAKPKASKTSSKDLGNRYLSAIKSHLNSLK